MRSGQRGGRTIGRDEARHRAAVIGRYVALDQPTKEEDSRFAAELGLTVDSLLRLSAAWRVHGTRLPMRGSRIRRPIVEGEVGAEILAEDVDMEGVDPSRREETLRRIRVIQGYLAPPLSEALTRADAAARIGVSETRFDALVREWTLHRRAAAMPGANVRPQRWYRHSPARLRVREILTDVASSAGRTASVKSIHDEMTAICVEEELTPLGLTQTHAFVKKVRAEEHASSSTIPNRGTTDTGAAATPSPKPRRSRAGL